MDLDIKRSRKKGALYDQSRIKWGSLTSAKVQELGERGKDKTTGGTTLRYLRASGHARRELQNNGDRPDSGYQERKQLTSL
ncbi:hypothetical protein HAX54_010680 [Datura stramonium]|uniref:Uncharacterized protein n=1 Tax=Datura stramonium TaxID=4076 RepID=A0ABS8TIJ2_DATST|nr:hypothetical protein [Datura stramonium]